MIARLRTIQPELLDHLDPNDPEARRSRLDLRRINFLMGNDRWIERSLRKFPESAARGITEWGAGDGNLIGKLVSAFPKSPFVAHDLTPRPAELDSRVEWRKGNVLQDATERRGILVANLFIHHFEGEELKRLGELCRDFDVLIFNEPHRAFLPYLLGFVMAPFVNRVTRHDLHLSVAAGFRRGEMGSLMGLKSAEWQVQESCAWRGALRAVVWRL